MTGIILNGEVARTGSLDSCVVTPVSGWFMFAYAFAQYSAWLALLTPVTITIAYKVSLIATPAEKANFLAPILAIGALFALFSCPIWGAVSDRTTARFGKRRLWILVGSASLFVGLATMAFAVTLWIVGLGWIICQIGSNAMQAALNAVLPDQVPEQQRGRMAALLGLTVTLAFVSGPVVTQFTGGNGLAMFLVPAIPMIIAVPMLLATLRDAPAQSAPPFRFADIGRTFWINPRKHPDFGWVFLSRFLLTMAAAFAHTYQVYFLTDRIGVALADVARAMTVYTMANASLTMLLTPLAGWLSDRIGRRKPFVIFPAIVVAAGLFGISTATTLEQFTVAAILVGVGHGIYNAVDVALCVAVLPDPDHAAKDLGIIQIANSLPQSLAPTLAALILTIGAGGSANYPAVFITATCFALAAVFAVLPIRGVR